MAMRVGVCARVLLDLGCTHTLIVSISHINFIAREKLCHPLRPNAVATQISEQHVAWLMHMVMAERLEDFNCNSNTV
eukprot:3233425-Amphidinium_carterae.1